MHHPGPKLKEIVNCYDGPVTFLIKILLSNDIPLARDKHDKIVSFSLFEKNL
jgi:hypothetical protein